MQFQWVTYGAEPRDDDGMTERDRPVTGTSTIYTKWIPLTAAHFPDFIYRGQTFLAHRLEVDLSHDPVPVDQSVWEGGREFCYGRRTWARDPVVGARIFGLARREPPVGHQVLPILAATFRARVSERDPAASNERSDARDAHGGRGEARARVRVAMQSGREQCCPWCPGPAW